MGEKNFKRNFHSKFYNPPPKKNPVKTNVDHNSVINYDCSNIQAVNVG